ncbi:MAG: hypothetical protein F6J93_34665 [Oscillatoria sp. SIO1A7]|nr:hypothetical protein [Oscillatoria sp. SIO1A7]
MDSLFTAIKKAERSARWRSAVSSQRLAKPEKGAFQFRKLPPDAAAAPVGVSPASEKRLARLHKLSPGAGNKNAKVKCSPRKAIAGSSGLASLKWFVTVGLGSIDNMQKSYACDPCIS